MQKDTAIKISSILQCRKRPEGIRMRLENHFSSTGDNKTHLPQRKPRETKKNREKIL